MELGNSIITIEGYAEPQFAQVLDAFVANFEQRLELGAAAAVYHCGRPVVDLAAGVCDRVSKTPYSRTTLQPVFSVTKGITAVVANMLADRCQLDIDAP